MYWEYFGFKEPPFALTPNPAFLFLSTPHQEAFAHLLFAIESRAGFIELSGEVGTGKTTIIRTLLNQLERETHRSALIFNPTLSPLGLFREINTEFGLPATSNDLQELHQALNAFLLEENRSGRTVVLVIDEAQNLSVEVLEQLRLISNLETERSKLIQIVMVGQPELRALLSRPELRQLDQRITVRYHLKPMGYADTCDYIRHRIRFAAGGSEPLSFSAGAVRKIFAFSGGLPRLVNVACDRALLLAYTSESREVTPAMAAASLSDLGRDLPRRPFTWGKASAVLALVAVLAAAGWSFFSDGYPAGQGAWKKGTWSGPGKADDLAPRQPGNSGERSAAPPEPQAPATAGASAASAASPTPTPAGAAAPQHGNFSKDRALRGLEALPEEENLREALNALLKIWQVPGFAAEPLKGVNFAVLAKTRGMNATRVAGNLDALARLDAPALLQVSVPGGNRVVALTGLGADAVQVVPALDGHATLSRAELGQVWNGTAYVFWKDFHGIASGKKPADQAARLKSLQGLLLGAGVYRGALDGVAGSKLTEAVTAFQRREGLPEDGKAKGLTLMLLYRRAGGFFPATLQRGGAGEPSAAARGKGAKP